MKKILIATDKPFASIAKTLISQVIQDAGYEAFYLEKYTSQTEFIAAVKEVDALIVRSDIVDAAVFAAAPNLKIVVRAGAGYDNIDLDCATKHHVCVMNTPGQNANAVGELVFGLLIYSMRNCFNGSVGKELKGRTLGIHAFGNVGKCVARIAKGFGMEVYGYDAFPGKEKEMDSLGVKHVDNVEELYNLCEIVSLHLPATELTKESVNANLLSRMPEDAILINTARQEIIDEKDLQSVMQSRKDFVFLADTKPLIDEQLKTEFPTRYYATKKKMGAQTEEANTNAGVAAAIQIVNFFKTGDEHFRVNL